MSNFAERLVARSTGRMADAGGPLLVPRPVARFETPGGLDVAADGPLGTTDRESTGMADTFPETSQQAEMRLRPAGEPMERIDRRTSTYRSVAVAKKAVGHPPLRNRLRPGDSIGDGAVLPSGETFAMPSRPADVPSAMRDEPRHAVDGGPEQSAPSEVPSAARTDSSSAEPVIGGAPLEALASDAPPTVVPEKQDGPAISIGRIEVQFLPKEAPPGPPAVRPQRTRGFNAYDRARRGLR